MANRQSEIQAVEGEDLLKVSAYDRAASMLIALLVLVGTAFLLLFILWLTSRVFFVKNPPMVLIDEESGTQNPPGSARDINEPGVEELDDLVEPDIKDQLAAVTDAVSSIAATLDAIDGAVATRGKGMGDNRKRGNGDDVIPRWQRWEVRYDSTTLPDYEKQLAFFNIELGAIGGGRPGVDYAFFNNGSLQNRSANDGKDDRIYFIWQGGKFKQQDQAILTRAGVRTAGRVTCQFYTKEMENQLALLERTKMGNRELREVQKTIFGVQKSGKGYEFYVMDIRWR